MLNTITIAAVLALALAAGTSAVHTAPLQDTVGMAAVHPTAKKLVIPAQAGIQRAGNEERAARGPF